MHKPITVIGEVLENRMVSDSMYLLEISLQQQSGFLPGQFCMVNWVNQPTTFGRPLSILACDDTKMQLLYKAVGSGTNRLASTNIGQQLELLTPLGNPFPKPDSTVPHILIAGGVGLPPMLSWSEIYGQSADVLCFGGRDGGDIPWELLSDNWLVSVDSKVNIPEGKTLFHGNVIEMLRSMKLPENATVLSCGPTSLLQAVKKLAVENSWECFVSVEERMGCGFGVCRGCVVPTVAGSYKTACKDGPVFNANDIKIGDEL